MIVKNVGIAIRDLGSVPSGHLYAQLMGILTLDQYNAIIDALKSAKMVSESGYLLTWIGPKE
jgi:hypothetical protein